MPMLDAAAERVGESTASGQDASAPVAGEPRVLLKLSEIVLKGRKRDQVERRLQNNIRAADKGLGIKIQIWQREGVIVVRTESGELADVDAVARRMTDVMGIVWVHRAWRVAKEPEATVQAALDLVGQHPARVRKGAFAIRSRRRDKRFPMTSSELNILLGSKVQEKYDLPVDLHEHRD